MQQQVGGTRCTLALELAEEAGKEGLGLARHRLPKGSRLSSFLLAVVVS